MRRAHGPVRLLGVVVALVTTMWAAPAQALSITAGQDVLLGQRAVTVRATSVTRASFVDSSIRRTQHPKLRVSLAPTRAGGTVYIKRGSTLLKRITMAPGTRQTVSLLRQRRGKWAISVRYRGSTAFGASSRTVYLRVR
jgi:hypothetical protein